MFVGQHPSQSTEDGLGYCQIIKRNPLLVIAQDVGEQKACVTQQLNIVAHNGKLPDPPPVPEVLR